MASATWIVGHERRPCTVKVGDKEKKALWYMFGTQSYYNTVDAVLVGQTGGQVGWESPCAVVEYEDGKVEAVGVEHIRFLDSKKEFEQYAWEESE